MIFFFLAVSSGHRGGLLPERADVGQSHAAKLHSSWGENLLWIKPRPQSGLVLISPLCVQSDWRGPDYRRYLWRLAAIWSQHSDMNFFGANWVYLDCKLRLDYSKAEPLLVIMSNFALNQRVILEMCFCCSEVQSPKYNGPWKWLILCLCAHELIVNNWTLIIHHVRVIFRSCVKLHSLPINLWECDYLWLS